MEDPLQNLLTCFWHHWSVVDVAKGWFRAYLAESLAQASLSTFAVVSRWKERPMLSRYSLISRFETTAIHSTKSSLQMLRAVSAISQFTPCTCMGLLSVFLQVTSLHRHNDPLGEGECYMHFNSENKHTHTHFGESKWLVNFLLRFVWGCNQMSITLSRAFPGDQKANTVDKQLTHLPLTKHPTS